MVKMTELFFADLHVHSIFYQVFIKDHVYILLLPNDLFARAEIQNWKGYWYNYSKIINQSVQQIGL